MRLGIVIPTWNESKGIQKLVSELKEELANLKELSLFIFVIDDLSKDKTGQVAKELGCIVPYHNKKLGFGKSLYEGLCLAWYTFDCDYVMEMDADHPVKEIKKFLKKKRTNLKSVVVGYEKSKWKFPRTVAVFLVRRILRFKELRHPTCGFILWSKQTLENIPWKHVKSRRDASHLELLFWAWRKSADFYEIEFSGHAGERHYGLGRIISWLISFMRLLRLRYLWSWRDF